MKARAAGAIYKGRGAEFFFFFSETNMILVHCYGYTDLHETTNFMLTFQPYTDCSDLQAHREGVSNKPLLLPA